MPARFSGSAALIVIRPPSAGRRRTSRSSSTACGSANCSPLMPADEPAAADLPARFEPAVDLRQLAPGGGVGLAGEQPAEDHAVAAQQRPGLQFDRLLAGRPVGRCPVERRPSAGQAAAPVVRHGRPRATQTSARRPANPSDAARPLAASPPSAYDSCSASSPLAATRSRKNDAPRPRRTERTARASSESAGSSPGGRRDRHAGACSGRRSAIGVAGTSPGGRPSAAGAGDRRVQPASPDRQTMSSSAGS